MAVGWAQEASIVGTVADASGAAMNRVTVVARNNDTGLERRATTDEGGRFSISPLAIGKYTLTAEFQGFRTTQVTDVSLNIGQIGRVDVVMQVGAVTERVEVKDTVALLQAEQAALGSSVEHKKIVDLPLNGRDFTQLVALTPGASQMGGSWESGNPQVMISGQRSSKTTSTIDGVMNVDQLFQGFPVSPSVDAIEEFRVQSGNFSAEQGMGPSNVAIRLKSGTNAVHGTAFEFMRNDKMDARNFFLDDREKLKRNQFGGNLGGPIKKDKMFYFFGYEGARQRSGGATWLTVPTAEQRQGNFAGLDPIIDPLSGTPFPDNRIPENRINSVATYFTQFYPEANREGRYYVYSPSYASNRDQYIGRYDYYVSDKSRLFVNYTLNNSKRYDPASMPAEGGLDRRGRAQNAGVNWSYTVSPNLLNTLVLGWARYKNVITPTSIGTNHTVESGLQGFDETSARFPGFPGIGIGSGYTGIEGYAWFPLINPTDNRQIKDDVSIVRGAHQIRFGVDLRKFMWSSQSATQSRGSLDYGGGYTGDGWADFMLGIPGSAFRQFPQANYNQISYNYGFYVNDDYRISKDVTLNLGLRYEYDSWPVDSRNQVTTFYPKVGKFVVAHKTGQGPDLDAQPLARLAWDLFGNLMMTAQDAGLPNRSLRYADKNNFGPRVGIAYRPPFLKSTVVRAGYGIFYNLLNGNNYSDFTATSIPWIISQGVGNTDPPVLDNQHLFTPFDAPGAASPNIQPIVFDPHARIPYIQEWNIAVQRQLSGNTTLEVAYVGNKGTRLETRLPFNRPDPGPGDYNLRRQFPDLSEGYQQRNTANSVYNSMQVKFEQTYSNGLAVITSYTWQKSIDDASSDYGSGALDMRNLRLDRAVSDFDNTHRFTAGYVYELPIGRGRKLLNGLSRPLDAVLGGWQLGGIVTLESGSPFTVGIWGEDILNNGSWFDRPNRTGSGKVSNPTIQKWFDPNAFEIPGDLVVGNSGRNILRTDAFANWDCSLLKNFTVREGMTVQLRGEFFNALNHPTFGGPDSNLLSDNVGRVFGLANSPRQGQVALKFLF